MKSNNYADRLLTEIKRKQNPSVIGLDPRIASIPAHIRKQCTTKYGNTNKAVAEAFIIFNKALIDATHDIVPAYKPQIAFYEKYGADGVRAFHETVAYAKSKGCLAIEDGKRNDIGSTAQAYAEGHLGDVELCDGSVAKNFDVDCITVNPYLGSDGVLPFIEQCKKHGKGVYVLVKTSNPSSGELQDKKLVDGNVVYETMAEVVNNWNQETVGELGYGSIGAVVGATYPEQAAILRRLMPNNIFLVPGYGAQGGGADGVVPCFNDDGQGAIVNSSRGVIFAYKSDRWKDKFNDQTFAQAARAEAIRMRDDIVGALKRAGKWERTSEDKAAEITEFLIRNNVFKFGDFTLKSGRRSPYFYNARNLSNGEALKQVSKYYADLIEENKLEFDVILGPAYAGITLAAGIANELATRGKSVRFVYDRKEIKEYGDKADKIFVGTLNERDRILIVDDMMTDGGTKLQMLEKIQAIGKKLKVVGLAILFDRQEKGKQGKKVAAEELKDGGLPVFSALKATESFDYLHNRELDGQVLVNDEIYALFEEYRKLYGA